MTLSYAGLFLVIRISVNSYWIELIVAASYHYTFD